MTDEDVRKLARQIERVYADADYVGSLVTQGTTNRPTAYTGSKVEPPDWWDRFWEKHLQDTGLTREETIRRLMELYGEGWMLPREQAEWDRTLEDARRQNAL